MRWRDISAADMNSLMQFDRSHPPAGWGDCDVVGRPRESALCQRWKKIQRMPETVTEPMDAEQKDGYPHFMLKEIHEQAHKSPVS